MNIKQEIEMPVCAKILNCAFKDEELVVWAEVHDVGKVRETEMREFYIAFTGAPIGDMPWFRYLNTLQQDGFVLHVYYKTN